MPCVFFTYVFTYLRSTDLLRNASRIMYTAPQEQWRVYKGMPDEPLSAYTGDYLVDGFQLLILLAAHTVKMLYMP